MTYINFDLPPRTLLYLSLISLSFMFSNYDSKIITYRSNSFIKRPKLNFSEHLLVLSRILRDDIHIRELVSSYLGIIISTVIIAYVMFWFWLLHSNTKGKIYQNAIVRFPTEIRGREVIVTESPKSQRPTQDQQTSMAT